MPPILLLVLALGDAAPGYPMHPAIHGDRLVVACADRLCLANLRQADGDRLRAQPIDGVPSGASHLAFDDRGERIAFTARVGFNTDVYVLTPGAARPLRLTFHPDDDWCQGFSGSGNEILFLSDRSHPLLDPELFTVAATGGSATELELGPVACAAAEPGGKRLAFCPGVLAGPPWRGYRGGGAPDVWLAASAAGPARELIAHPGNDGSPQWVDGRIVFLSDRDGSLEFYSVLPDGSDLRRLTRFAKEAADGVAAAAFPPRWPRADARRGGTRVVFVQGADLGVLDVESREVRRFRVSLPEEALAEPEPVRPLADAAALAISPDGAFVTVAARGALVAFDRHRASGASEWLPPDTGVDDVQFLPDGRSACTVFRADRSAVLLLEPGGTPRPLLELEDDSLVDAEVAPDAARVAFVDSHYVLRVREVASGETWDVPGGRYEWSSEMRFSPDGRWLAFTAHASEDMQVLQLLHLESRRVQEVGDRLRCDSLPRFDPDGRWLYFAADDLAPAGSTCVLRALPLRSRSAPPWLPDAGAPDAADGAPGDWITPDADAAALAVTLEVLEGSTIVELEPLADAVAWAEADADSTDDGDNPLVIGPCDRTLRLRRFDDEGPTTLARGIAAIAAAPEAGLLAILAYDGKPSLRTYELDGGEMRHWDRAAAFTMEPDLAQETAVVLGQAWRWQRDFFFNPTRVGDAWREAWLRHALLAPRVRVQREKIDLLRELLRELDASHLDVQPRSDHGPWPTGSPEAEWYDTWEALLGADLRLHQGRVYIDRVLRAGGREGEVLRGPLDAPWLDLGEECWIFAVDGQTVWPTRDLYAELVGRDDDVVELELADDPFGKTRRTITVRGLSHSDELDLRYADFVERNRRRVLERTQGRVGYVHLWELDEDTHADLYRQVTPQAHLDGLVVDVRGNLGGHESAQVLRLLAGRAWAVDVGRNGAFACYPEDACHGPMALVIDRTVASDGEWLALHFRRLGLGPLVGERTSGWMSGCRQVLLADGTWLNLPLMTSWNAGQGFHPEGTGVAPDVEVHFTPVDHLEGRDPLLEAAIEAVIEQLTAAPPRAAPRHWSEGTRK